MVRRQEIFNFMAPTQRVCNLGVKSVKLMYSFKNFFSPSGHGPYKLVIMTKEASTKIVNIMTPGIGVLVQGRGHIVNMQYFISSSCLH